MPTGVAALRAVLMTRWKLWNPPVSPSLRSAYKVLATVPGVTVSASGRLGRVSVRDQITLHCAARHMRCWWLIIELPFDLML